MNLLFLCTGNSCRSIMAEALAKQILPNNVQVQSAGSIPTGIVHPCALAVLKKSGLSTDGLTSKSWNNLPLVPDVVITLCSGAAGEACPLYFGKVVRSHWEMADPAQVTGDGATIEAAFLDAFNTLQRRINALAKLPLQTFLASDISSLQSALDAISRQ